MDNLIWYQHKTKPEIKIILGELDNAGWSYECTVIIKDEILYSSTITVEQLKEFRKIGGSDERID